MRTNLTTLTLGLALTIFTGCAQLDAIRVKVQGVGTPAEQELFLAGITRLQQGEEAPFRELKQEYPEGPWLKEAHRLIAMRDQSREEVRSTREELETANSRITNLEQQKAKQDAYIQALKDLIVRLELER